MNLESKLAIGTAQFGMSYGISNDLGIPDDLELKNIFDIASFNGINILDTAPAYGNAEGRIGLLSENRFSVVTKFVNVANRQALKDTLDQSLKQINSEQLYAYMAHNSHELILKPDLWEFLSAERDSGRIKKIGYSLYTTDQLEKLLLLQMKPDIVQLPYNLIDRKFEEYLPELKGYGTEIHIRSVFLQGFFFMNPYSLPEKLKPLKSTLVELKRLCIENNLTISQVLISYVNHHPLIDKSVVGVASAKQLLENIRDITSERLSNDLLDQIELITVADRALLNPVNWK
ncbi:MAG: aldo/keto reductase [Cyclobacteriaceae bacterium]|nr:aldo/keto reductase [Cyclobacteriaceae bacterium]